MLLQCPLLCCRSGLLHFYWGRICATSLQHWEAAGCGSINLLATATWKQRSSALYASLLGCMRCAPVGEVDCEMSTERSTSVSVRLSRSGLWRFVSLDGGDLLLFCVVFRRRSAPSGLRKESLACSFVVKVWFEVANKLGSESWCNALNKGICVW